MACASAQRTVPEHLPDTGTWPEREKCRRGLWMRLTPMEAQPSAATVKESDTKDLLSPLKKNNVSFSENRSWYINKRYFKALPKRGSDPRFERFACQWKDINISQWDRLQKISQMSEPSLNQ
ncbi:hypothetical protein AbraIFM66950_006418 [Aspergillus brasiliensis]|nr:hypothetical protein AbraIFM66950_006418 [Aspergillus brasiliensis]